VTHVRVNGIELEYADEGTGVPVVFSHGGGSDLRYWEPQRKIFAERYRFVAYSWRFHGTGPSPDDGDYSQDAHVADLVALVRRLDVGAVHLVGFSSSIALHAAIQEPDLVRSLTIVEPNVPWLLEGSSEGESVLAWWREQSARNRPEAGGDAERAAVLFFETVNNRGPGAFDTQAEGLRRMWLDNACAKPAAPDRRPLTCEQLGAIKAPTLVIGGEYGMRYSAAITHALVPCIPDSRLVVIPRVTHFMSYQQPDAFNEVVLGFLAQH
jgi:non-heme chloroperoxidase